MKKVAYNRQRQENEWIKDDVGAWADRHHHNHLSSCRKKVNQLRWFIEGTLIIMMNDTRLRVFIIAPMSTRFVRVRHTVRAVHDWPSSRTTAQGRFTTPVCLVASVFEKVWWRKEANFDRVDRRESTMRSQLCVSLARYWKSNQAVHDFLSQKDLRVWATRKAKAILQ